MCIRLNFLLLIAICVASVLTVTAQPPPSIPTMDMTDSGLGGGNIISGTVRSTSNNIAGRPISVKLVTATRGERVGTTDEHGRFRFSGLPAGDYTVVIDKEKGFQPVAQNLTIIQTRGMPPQTYYVTVELVPVGRSPGQPEVVNAGLASVPKESLDMYKKGQQLADEGKHQEAIEQFKQAIDAYPDFALAYNEMGVQFLKLNDLKSADAAFQKALGITPDLFNAMVNHGIALYSLQQYKDAEPLFRKVVTQKPDQPVGHYFLGQTLAYLGNFDEAESELSTTLKMGGAEFHEAYRFLAIIHANKGNKKQAADDLEKYLKLNPKAGDADSLRDTIKKFRSGN